MSNINEMGTVTRTKTDLLYQRKGGNNDDMEKRIHDNRNNVLDVNVLDLTCGQDLCGRQGH